jgi:uncharacterized damage-inducible protein DinB
MKTKSLFVSCVIALLLQGTVYAQAVWKDSDGKEITGVRAIMLDDYAIVRKKIVDLATAMPEETYKWRPMEGVRSVSEVYTHIAGSNYALPSMIGYKAPEGIKGEDDTSITEKNKVLEYLNNSFDYIKDILLKVPESDFGKPADFFGQKTTYEGVLLNIVMHWHEHLGQSIAYARMNNVVPPWTAAAEARQKSDQKK